MSTSLQAVTISFPSTESLERAVAPWSLDEVQDQIEKSSTPLKIHFKINPQLKGKATVPNHQPVVGNLLQYPVYTSPLLTVFCPESSRVPYHLVIALNSENVKGISDVTSEENQAIFDTIKKITEIYKKIGIHGFVTTQHNTPQLGQQNRYVVEIIPHLPGFQDIKNIPDKLDCNRYVLFRQANISAAKLPEDMLQTNQQFWEENFQTETAPIPAEDLQISFPHQRQEAYQSEAEELMLGHLIQILTSQEGVVENPPNFDPLIPTDIPTTTTFVDVKECAFCNPKILQRQEVCSYEGVTVLYNIRKGPCSGTTFLIVPQRHTATTYDLSPKEIETIRIVRKALVEVLQEKHPDHNIADYIQGNPAVGQTVRHTHEQVVWRDANTVAWTWTFSSLYPWGNVSDQEMKDVTSEFAEKLHTKLFESIPK